MWYVKCDTWHVTSGPQLSTVIDRCPKTSSCPMVKYLNCTGTLYTALEGLAANIFMFLEARWQLGLWQDQVKVWIRKNVQEHHFIILFNGGCCNHGNINIRATNYVFFSIGPLSSVTQYFFLLYFFFLFLYYYFIC